MNDQALSKIRGHAEHLLDLHIGLRNKYAPLAPLLPGGFVVAEKRSGPAVLGLNVVRVTLFLSCVQDLAKATLDKDKRAPSLVNIVSTLADTGICNALRQAYMGSASESTDVNLGAEFDSTLAQTKDDWQHLQQTKQLASCQMIRDKLIAHTEARLDGATYVLLDVGSLDLKWTDVGALTLQLEDIVVGLNKIIRCANFDFDDLNSKLERAQNEFWRMNANTR
jgi:hypothetical protein